MKKSTFFATIFAAIVLTGCGDSSTDSPVTAPLEDTPPSNILTDSRDGKTYNTVVIGSQTWMAENLNFEAENSSCYDDNPSNCAKYGRLYAWASAMDSAGLWSSNGKDCGNNTKCTTTYPVRGVCPSGWHLPTKEEFKTLVSAVGTEDSAGKKLKSVNGWAQSSRYSNTDDYSFTALPGGHKIGSDTYYNEGENAFFWSSTEIFEEYAYYLNLYYNANRASLGYLFKRDGFSVRCVKD